MKPILLTLLGLAAIDLHAGPVQWTVASGGNDHYYEAVVGGFDQGFHWTIDQAQADLAANHASFLGLPGYLVTITSANEQNFILSLVTGHEFWTSGTDVGSPGNWYWTGGPEAGQAFSFDNWGGPPPSGANQLYLEVGICGVGCWAADSGTRQPGYVVEYSAAAAAGAPEPGTLSFVALAIAAVAGRRYRRR
jgi:Lectin C-type domain